MCGDPSAAKIGIVADLSSLVNESLEALLYCAQVVDAYKAEKAAQEQASLNKGPGDCPFEGRDLYTIWFEHLQKARSCIGVDDQEGLLKLVEEADEIAVTAEGTKCSPEILAHFQHRKGELEALRRRCVNMKRHLPVLSKRLGAQGEQMEAQFEGLLQIINERCDLADVVCALESGNEGEEEGGEDDDDLAINFEMSVLFEALGEKFSGAVKQKEVSKTAKRIARMRGPGKPKADRTGWNKGVVDSFFNNTEWDVITGALKKVPAFAQDDGAWSELLKECSAFLVDRKVVCKRVAGVVCGKSNFEKMKKEMENT
jgi:hypothetical protein